MDTPICDFVRRYAQCGTVRLHMPGHKGAPILGCEHLDITEISGADSLYEASGIIKKSEDNASRLFGCPTFYSTEGSSQCIRAMLYLAMLKAKQQGQPLRIAAGRNAHKTFLSAAALLDVDVDWLYPEESSAYLSCDITKDTLETYFSGCAVLPVAVYVTSPDYLGNLLRIDELAEVCHRHGALLLVDNAHGAYLRFLSPSQHPMDLDADLCCDSAHKTLPVLTGGAYLHIRDAQLAQQAKNALALFGSTSPSYLILQSLDAVNPYLAGDYPEQLATLTDRVDQLKDRLSDHGYLQIAEEPLKITVSAKKFGYTGDQLADLLKKHGIICEFSDPDFLVLMVTPQLSANDLAALEQTLLEIPRKAAITTVPPTFHCCEAVLPVREAMLSVSETVSVAESVGRILAAPSVGCPPAVPIVVCGERIDNAAAQVFAYYGIGTCTVVK